MSNLATLGGNFSPCCPHALRNLSQVASRLTFPFSSTTKVHLQISWRDISIHCRLIHSALSKLSNSRQFSNITKQNPTAASNWISSPSSWFKWIGRHCVDHYSFTRSAVTKSFFRLLNALQWASNNCVASNCNENSVCFRQIGGMPSAQPMSDKSSLTSSGSYSL